MKGYIVSLATAEEWNITEPQVQLFGKKGKIPGAVKTSRIWAIPEAVPKPMDSKRRVWRKNVRREVAAGE